MADTSPEDVLLELKKSFLEDRHEIQRVIEDIETRIAQNKSFISSLNRKEDCDYSLFSPRNVTRVYKDQVFEKQVEIENLEESLAQNYKKLSNITKKLDSLNSIKLQASDEPREAEKPADNSLFIKLQEDDRRRIAADLHDGALQNLSLVMHNMELSEKFIDNDPVRAKLELPSNRKLVKETIDEIRRTIYNLRPMQFDDFGFQKSLENLLDSYKSRTEMEITYSIDSFEHTDSVILLTVFRIIQELAVNSIKHSKGTELKVLALDEQNHMYIEVTDNGLGMAVSSAEKENHFGLRIVKERVASLGGKILFPVVDKGCKAVIEIPYQG